MAEPELLHAGPDTDPHVDPRALPTFRRRLVGTLGAGIALTLALFSGLVLLGAWAHMTRGARLHLGSEVRNIAEQVVDRDRLDLDAPPWDEPHHRYTEAHIDPHFVQVFDAEGRPLRSSTNVARLGEAFPARLLPVTEQTQGMGPLATFNAGGIRFYHFTIPLVSSEQRMLGYLQVSRYEPGIAAQLRRFALALGGGYAVALTGLLALLWTVGGRVVRPLEAMTAGARRLSPDRLDQRVPIPEGADRETAELGRALNDALDRLESAFEEVRRFTADAAHELQTPLTVLMGHVEVALRRERSPEAYRETLRLLRGEVEDLARLVRALLSLARLEGVPRAPEPVELGRLAEEEAEAVRPRAEAQGLSLRVEAAPDTEVLGHPPLLRDAVHNLLDNAVKYTEAGEVRLRVERHRGHVTLTVEDTGRGIAAEHLPRATARFWRADTVQHLPGSGLGLALVEQVAAHHGGRLHLASTVGAGTTAELRLPAVDGSRGRDGA